MNLLPDFLTCQACGAVLPQAKGPRRRVSTFRYVCDCQCRRDYFERLAGFPLYADVLAANAGHIGTVRISKNDLDPEGRPLNATVRISSDGSGGAVPDYREHLDWIVGEIADAMDPRDMPGGPSA